MAQSLSRVIIHIIFSTKDRNPLIKENFRPVLHAYLAKTIRSLDASVFKVGGTVDHVHIACTLPRTMTQSDFIKYIKTSSTKWVKENYSELFSWQKGYGIFSVGESQLKALVNYIEKQVEHHKVKTFEDEYRAFLSKYNIEFKEEFLWE